MRSSTDPSIENVRVCVVDRGGPGGSVVIAGGADVDADGIGAGDDADTIAASLPLLRDHEVSIGGAIE
ncbi:hypothetical protein [Nocardia noduli]|uniref:hypothetical protein n=1 Tax=Nocardia noduli TaxID=2815722 RepID=UPI001C219C6A|nr:hypothetical protein [Nocardia noduli]